MLDASDCKTQKAAGFLNLGYLASSVGEAFSYVSGVVFPAAVLLEEDNMVAWRSMAQFMRGSDGPLFVRPCPVRPRHGFVDSQEVSVHLGFGGTMSDLVDKYREKIAVIAREALDADPDAEIIVSRWINSVANAIITPYGVTVGPGHDGATSGKASINIPVGSNFVNASMRKRFRINDDEAPYLETVEDISWGYSPKLTQVRAGPANENVDNFVPADTLVTTVIEVNPGEDLLEWEQKAQAYGQSKGVVVYHEGGSIASHFGVHCVINTVPYVTTFKPVVGEELKRTARSKWKDEDFQYVANLVRYYDDDIYSGNYKSLANLVFAGLHAMGSLMQSRNEYGFRLAAASLVAGAKLFTGVASGEARHGANSTLSDTPANKLYERLSILRDVVGGKERNEVYDTALTTPISFTAHAALASYYLYSQPQWNSGYGGPPWAQCAAATYKYTSKLIEFVVNPSRDSMAEVLSEFNRLIHLAHNNGWWLNKVADEGMMNRLSKHPAIGLVNRFTYDTLVLKGHKTQRPMDEYEGFKVKAGVTEGEIRDAIMSMKVPPPKKNSGFTLGGAHKEQYDEYKTLFKTAALPTKFYSGLRLRIPFLKTPSGRQAIMGRSAINYMVKDLAWLFGEEGAKTAEVYIRYSRIKNAFYNNDPGMFELIIPNNSGMDLKHMNQKALKHYWDSDMNAFRLLYPIYFTNILNESHKIGNGVMFWNNRRYSIVNMEPGDDPHFPDSTFPEPPKPEGAEEKSFNMLPPTIHELKTKKEITSLVSHWYSFKEGYA